MDGTLESKPQPKPPHAEWMRELMRKVREGESADEPACEAA